MMMISCKAASFPISFARDLRELSSSTVVRVSSDPDIVCLREWVSAAAEEKKHTFFFSF